MPPEPETPHAYTKISLNDVEDAAVPNGLGHRWEARVAREPLGAEETGMRHFQLRPGQRSPLLTATDTQRRST